MIFRLFGFSLLLSRYYFLFLQSLVASISRYFIFCSFFYVFLSLLQELITLSSLSFFTISFHFFKLSIIWTIVTWILRCFDLPRDLSSLRSLDASISRCFDLSSFRSLINSSSLSLIHMHVLPSLTTSTTIFTTILSSHCLQLSLLDFLVTSTYYLRLSFQLYLSSALVISKLR